MKTTLPTTRTLAWGACSLLASGVVAQTPVPSPAPPASAGIINDRLRGQDPAAAAWDLGVQFRVRYESRNGGAVAGTGPASVDFNDLTQPENYWLLRERVHVGYRPADWIGLFAEGRDSSAHGDRRVPGPEADSFDLHQAYVTLGAPARFPVTAKIGRQELSYGDERLIGAFDWNNLGRVFDAAKLRFENDALWVDAFSGRVVLANDGAFNVANDYDWFSGVYASSRKLVPHQESQLYLLSRNTASGSPTATSGSPQAGGPTARDIYTLGVRFKSTPGELGGWDYDGDFAGQLGRVYDAKLGKSLDHQAFAAHLAGGYTWKDAPLSPRAGLEYDFSTGDSNSSDGKHGTFENLFPTNHRFYGFMDFVSWQNMHDVRLATSAKPSKALTLTADAHLFWLADTHDYFYAASGAPRKTGGYGIQPGNSPFVGSEIDVIATYAIRPWATFQGGYGHFFRGDYVRQALAASGSKDADWFYAQLTLGF
ncbi:MAG: hypothetical protein DVB31_17235 [Verrucomicrobia bacterium]|nr:MAG: hypothetical protein DVB31_17235 [Verrucomicrobiota bacterium]